jgi:hypothetical protein
MGARRLTSVVSQTTLGEGPELLPPAGPSPEPSRPPLGVPSPRVYSTVVSSGTELRERQLRWFKERERRRPRAEEPEPTNGP